MLLRVFSLQMMELAERARQANKVG